jgi:hypothetical protein
LSGVGTNGGYGSPVTVDGQNPDIPYPPGPILWTAGQSWPFRQPGYVFATDLNQQLSAAVAFLAQKPMFQGAQYTDQALTPVAHNPITLDTEITDPWGMHSDGSDSSQVVCPPGCDGVYLVSGQVPFAAAGTTGLFYSEIGYIPSGSTGASGWSPGPRLQPNGSRVGCFIADLVGLNEGDAIQLSGWQTTTGSVNTWVSTLDTPAVQYADFASPTLSVRWVASFGNVPGGAMNVQVPAAWVGSTPTMATATAQLAVPSPRTWTNVTEATSDEFNTDIRDATLFLANVPVCRAAAATPAAVSSGTAHQVTGITESRDNWGGWSAPDNTWTCPVSGVYLVYGQVAFGNASGNYDAYAQLHCTVSGSTVDYLGENSYATAPCSAVMRQVRFSAGDTMQLYAFQNSGSSQTPLTSQSTRLFTLWQSA